MVCVWLALSVTACVAGETTETGRALLDNLLKATEMNDCNRFVADGDAGFKAGITTQMLERVSTQLSPRMKMGYQCSYLGELSQRGCQVLLWKLKYKDGGDDILAKLVLRDGKVVGFLLQ